jgi:hypothetical protein
MLLCICTNADRSCVGQLHGALEVVATVFSGVHTRAMEPIAIYRSVNRDGETYSLPPRSLRRLRESLGASARLSPRLFLARESPGPRDAVDEGVAPHIIQLLTGLTEERLRERSGASVAFLDPHTEAELKRAR